MSLVVNNNMMAANTARNLNAHYGRLATSTQRLSSGLRINSAADDAAGLAIRELQRADIATLHQGARNANDAISMIQVADGALGIIDEKLIRMKELAEQAATGTYDSTQRLMIESEYQAMASEITRIANATDFNGMKLLDGTLDGEHDGSELTATGKMKIHFGTGNDSAEDYYYITIGDCTAAAFGVGNASTWQDVQERGAEALEKSLISQIKNSTKLSDAEKGQLLAEIPDVIKTYNAALTKATDPMEAYKLWTQTDIYAGDTLVQDNGFLEDGKIWESNSDLLSQWLAIGAQTGDGTAVTPQTIIDGVKEDLNAAVNKFALEPLAAGEVLGAPADVQKSIVDSVLDAARVKGYSQDTIDAIETEINDATALAVAGGGNLASTDIDTWVTAVNGKLDAMVTAANTDSTKELAVEADAINAKTGSVILSKLSTELKNSFEKNVELPGLEGKFANKNDFDAAVALVVTDVMKLASDLGFDAQGVADLKDFFDNVTVTDPADFTKPTETELSNYKDALLGFKDDSAVLKAAAIATGDQKMEEFWNGLRPTQQQKLQYAWGQAAVYNLTHGDLTNDIDMFGMGLPANLGFGAGFEDEKIKSVIDSIMKQALSEMNDKIGDRDFAGFTVETQEDAQHALEAINEAIVEKDKIRAHLGATQNRLENTVSNLNIQAENLQAAESRISDVDVATEMTQFVRNQILTQSAVAMLSQANSLPQMAMQLIGG